MRRAGILLAVLVVVAGTAGGMENHGSVGFGHGIAVPGPRNNPCGASGLSLNYDGSAENGYCWQYAGVVPPYYGAFAECYSSVGGACGIELMLTGIGNPCRPCDLYAWDDAGGSPGNVISMTPAANPCPVATWPNISTHDFAFYGGRTIVDGIFWAGYWADFSNQPPGYFVAADLDGFGGCPFTYIAPGIGYPTGWNDVSVVWGPTQAIGIGVWTNGIPPPPPSSVPYPSGTKETTWGRIKQTYR